MNMEDLLQSQIQDSCRLALPAGLKELMSDISREVLRAQPPNLLKFITNYLSTLLVTRENLYIAAKVCSDVCDCSCCSELEDELRDIGLDENVAINAAGIIVKYFRTDEVKEGNLLLKLLTKTSIEESELPTVQAAIRRAFLRHKRNHTKIYETSSSSDEDESERAVRHTLGLYRKTEPSTETYNSMARKIQASYRAYRVRREKGTTKVVENDQLSKTPSRSESIRSNGQEMTPKYDKLDKTKVTFGAFGAKDSKRTLCKDGDVEQFKNDVSHKPSRSATRLSSTSLAGSYLNLPQFIPYSAHDHESLTGVEETPEKERSNYDYTRENSPFVEEISYNLNDDERNDFDESSNEESVEENKQSIGESFEEEDIAKSDIFKEYMDETDDVEAEAILNIEQTEEITDKAEGTIEENIVVENKGVNGTDSEVDEDIIVSESTLEENQEIEDEVEEVIVVPNNFDENILEPGKEEEIVEENIIDGIVEDLLDDLKDIDVTGSY